MKIVVDIGHPAHVHYFKHFIREMERRGHEILITASQKEVTFSLLKSYGFQFVDMGSFGKSLFRKVLNVPEMDVRMYRAVKKFDPDILMGFASFRAAHISSLLRKKCIIFDDTEHSIGEILLYKPFADAICTPSCFKRDLGKKQVRFNGYMELAHLHPKYFIPNPAIVTEAGISKNESFTIVRFVSWQASHDRGHKGIERKIELVKRLEDFGPVLITSEKGLPKELQKNSITVSPEKVHDLMYYASLLFGESATMASECAVLGTHAIFLDFAGRGYTDEEEAKYQLVYNFKLDIDSQERAIEKAINLLQRPLLKEEGWKKRDRMLQEKIDVTSFLVWFVENYPESYREMKENPGRQQMFRTELKARPYEVNTKM
jgi:predicted glycosyltransferase